LGKRNSGIDCEKCGSGIKNGKCSTSGDETYKGKMNRLVSNRKSQIEEPKLRKRISL